MADGVVLLPSLDEQVSAGDRHLVDPASVAITESVYIVADNSNYMSAIGNAYNVRLEDGRLVGDVVIVTGPEYSAYSVATAYEIDDKSEPIDGTRTLMYITPIRRYGSIEKHDANG